MPPKSIGIPLLLLPQDETTPLYRNKRFALNKMYQQNASKYAQNDKPKNLLTGFLILKI